MKLNKLLFIIIISISLFTSCYKKEIPVNVQKVIKLSRNKKDLEKLFVHYSKPKDSLKFKAACYLIENMQGKGFYSGKKLEELDAFFPIINKEWKNTPYKLTEKEIEQVWDSVQNSVKSSHFVFKQDLNELDYQFLKATIDHSYNTWQNQPYSRHVSFTDYLEYIMPYRSQNEQPEENKSVLLKKYNWLLDSLKDKTDPVEACIVINNELKSWFKYIYNMRLYPGTIKISDIYLGKVGTCGDMANLAVVTMRALGIPVAIDYVTQWSNKESGHSWNVVFDKEMKARPFMGAESNPGEMSKYWEAERAAKVFRKTYKNNVYVINDYEQNIPDQFININYNDVTDEYIPVTDVVIDISKIPGNLKYAYICAFNNENWNPVFYGEIIDGKTIFKNMGREAVYLPVICQNKTLYMISNPIKVNSDGSTKIMQANNNKTQTMILTRKYPLFPRIDRFIKRMIGGRFQGANLADFSDAKDIYYIKENPAVHYNEIEISINEPFKYFRYIGPDTGYSDIAEIEFYGSIEKNTDSRKLEGKIIGQGENFMIYKEAFDGNRLSYFYSVEPGNKEWVGMEMDKPVYVKKIRFISRNDDNAIRIGDEYELFYWDNNWISAGKKVALQHKLIYNNIPTNTIYWLRNHTRGREERIFTYENGEQVWY